MKTKADTHRRDVQLDTDNIVYLRLRPYHVKFLTKGSMKSYPQNILSHLR